MLSSFVLPDGQTLEAPIDSPLGILLNLIAQLPPPLYQILSCEGGETYQKTEQIAAALGAFSPDTDDIKAQSYHVMAALVRQTGVNYDEPVLLCYLKPVFASKAFSPWTIQTSAERGSEQPHLVLNKQRASAEIARHASAKDLALEKEYALEMVDSAEVELLTGMQPGWVNLLMEPEYYLNGFVTCLLQSDMIQMRPGETEYLGGRLDQSLDTAIIEVPLGREGKHYTLLCNGSTLFWILTEIQKECPQIQFLHHHSPRTDVLWPTLWQLGESLKQGLKSFRPQEGVSVFAYFSSMEKFLEKYILAHQPYIQSDTVAVFIKEFIRNFFAVEGRLLYAMADVVLSDTLEHEERLREALYLFYRAFVKTEFAKSMTVIDFDAFIQKLCADLLDQGIINELTLELLLQNERYHKLLEKYLPKKGKVKDFFEKADPSTAHSLLLKSIKEDPRVDATKGYLRYAFSQETAKSEKYFVLHAQIADLLPRFIARAARADAHPLLTLESLQQDIVRFFAQRSQALGIGDSTIDNVTQSFMRIIFGKQIQLLDIIEDKLTVCGVSLQAELGVDGVIGPCLARMYDRAEYVALRERRKQRTEHLCRQIWTSPPPNQQDSAYHQLVFAIIRPDLENVMNLESMRDIFRSSQNLYKRLTTVAVSEAG